MSPYDISMYLKRFARESVTEQEKHDFLEWLNTISMDEAAAILDQYRQILEETYPPGEAADPQLVSRIEASLDRLDPPIVQIPPRRSIIQSKWFLRIAAACILLIGIAASLFYSFHNREFAVAKKQLVSKKQPTNPIGSPGTNKATLILADNSVLLLDDATEGTLAEQGNARVAKLGTGQLVYDAISGRNVQQVLFNTLTTPKGGQYKLILPDGSKVWLNAASSIKYPTVFTGKTREVVITGEAYFEVVHNDDQPFRVLAGGVEIEDLGTSFNVNAYDNEAVVNTTLVEGIVNVRGGGSMQQLVPGQQSLLHKNGKLVLEKNADVNLAVAWKNGFTQFKSADIQTIMRQVERWYDLEVVYDGAIPERTFTGGVARDAVLSELLTILQLSKIHCRIEDKRLVVTP